MNVVRCGLLLGVLATSARADFTAVKIADARTPPATANRDYQLYVPAAAGKEPLPLVVYLHGAGAKGSDNRKPITEPLPKRFADAKTQAAHPCFVLVPQCRAGNHASGRPNNWVAWVGQKDRPSPEWAVAEPEPTDQLRAAMLALDDVLATRKVDPRRVYVTGVSMGGSGAWYWAAHAPTRFAAVLTVCGISDPATAGKLATVPVWAFHGSDDPAAPAARSRTMVAAIEAAGGKPKLTEFRGEGHNIVGKVLAEGNGEAIEWLFAQTRPERAK